MQLQARAKINLSLVITGRRPDGFHELDTLMVPLSLADEVELTERPSGIELAVEGSGLSNGPDNLAWRAADLFFKHTGRGEGVHIRLKKNIPAGGGLAGGSSDAAAVLKGLNELYEVDLPAAELAQLAAELGSDISFFLQDQPALCTGRGEIVEPVELHQKLWALLVNPGFGVATPWAYQTYAADPKKSRQGRLNLHIVRKAGGGEKVESFHLRNDLEPAVFTKHLWIPEAKEWLAKQPGVQDALMSGSGATVFALTGSQADAEKLLEAARANFGSETWLQVAEVNPA